jgi:hypothetical protein
MGSCHTTVLPCHCDNPLVVGTVYFFLKKKLCFIKRVVTLWSHVRPVVRFVEHTSGGPTYVRWSPPTYVHATDTSVRPPDLTYIRHLRVSFQLSFPKVQGTLRPTLRVLGFRLCGYTKGSG